MNEHSFIGINELAMTERKTRKKPTPSPRQEQILKSAVEIFSRKGYAAATVPEIARLAGVATGTIYIYYPSKRELFVAVIKNLIITTPLLDLIEKLPREKDIGATFKHILQDRFRLIESEPMSRMPSLMGEVQRDPELKALWAKQFLQPFLSQMDGMYRIMTASGKFRPLEPAVAARAVGGLILGFLMLRIMEGESSPINRMPREKVAEEMTKFVLHGLLNDTGEKKIDKEDAL
jgi:AcrR family transcriptional regulator